MRLSSRFLLRTSAVCVALGLLSACQSVSFEDKKGRASLVQTLKPQASEMFGRYQHTTESTAQARLVQAIAEHLSKERVVVSDYYTQEVPNLMAGSLDEGADPLWVTISKMRERSHTGQEEVSHAYRQIGDYSDEEGLYLRYYDEVAGTTPSEKYEVSRLDGLTQAYRLNAPVQRLNKGYRRCVKRASYELDDLIKKNPAITTAHSGVQHISDTLSACLYEVDKKVEKERAFGELGAYQQQDVAYLRQCVSGYQKDLASVLSPTRTQKRYDGKAYDSYDSVYGHYAVCAVGYTMAYRSEPDWYLNQDEVTKTQLDLMREVRQCALTTNQNKETLIANGDTYATKPQALEENFYQHFACLDGAIDKVYTDNENSAIDVLRSSAPNSMAEVSEKYQLLKEVVAEKEQETYGWEEEDREYQGFLSSMFDEYFKMKKAELTQKDKEESDKPALLGIGGLYGAVASEFLTTMQRTPEQMTARNLYQYDNTYVQILSHHNPSTRYSQAVLAMDFELPTATQSFKLPMQANFATGEVLVDMSATLPIMMWLLPPEHMPTPDDFEGKVGVTAFKIPKELNELVPSDVIYDALQKGIVQALSELNPNVFTAVDISDDPFAKDFGATRAVKVTFDARQVGVFVSLVSKQLIKELSAYVENNPDIYNKKADGASLTVAEELAQKSRQKHAKKIKELIEQWALLDKGYVSADAGGILSVILGIAPINVYQSNYYYLNAKGELVGQMARADIDSRVVGAKTKSLSVSRYSYQSADFDKHALADSLGISANKAFDGNAWLASFAKAKTLRVQARLARESYEEMAVEEQAPETADLVEAGEAENEPVRQANTQ